MLPLNIFKNIFLRIELTKHILKFQNLLKCQLHFKVFQSLKTKKDVIIRKLHTLQITIETHVQLITLKLKGPEFHA